MGVCRRLVLLLGLTFFATARADDIGALVIKTRVEVAKQLEAACGIRSQEVTGDDGSGSPVFPMAAADRNLFRTVERNGRRSHRLVGHVVTNGGSGWVGNWGMTAWGGSQSVMWTLPNGNTLAYVGFSPPTEANFNTTLGGMQMLIYTYWYQIGTPAGPREVRNFLARCGNTYLRDFKDAEACVQRTFIAPLVRTYCAL